MVTDTAVAILQLILAIRCHVLDQEGLQVKNDGLIECLVTDDPDLGQALTVFVLQVLIDAAGSVDGLSDIGFIIVIDHVNNRPVVANVMLVVTQFADLV